MIRVSLVFALFGVAASQDFPGDSERLVHLSIAYRHGDRAPVSLYPKDANKESFWKRGLGELTKEGCRMHYKMGSFLKAHYSNFITGDPKEIHVQSSDKNRCLDSASCHLAGMYRPAPEQRFLVGLPWQPVPVHTRPNDEDGLLAPGNNNCPNADRAYELLKTTPEAKQSIEKYKSLYSNLSRWTGANITDWESAGRIYDTIMIERLYGLNVPQWAIDSYDELENQEDLSFIWYAKSPILQRLRAGLLAKEILNNMLLSVTKNSNDVRIHMYSTHDTEIASLLQLFDVFDGKAPRYCATVLVELWQDVSGGNYSVKIYYSNYFSMNARLVLSMPLGDFEARISSKLPEDWALECGRSQSKVAASDLRFPTFKNRGQ
ncbi:lysosomal acid phosphatase [Galendromus occidentalis]|uniref:Lysosomal acid phosphatase n=1 Tax=Galendromus occidentalis TaxID=34638 RepID=A0AAJ7P9Z5_9ACAR|nr:lysosomal acid phosphatase [Galendromus occidentalis]